MREKRCRGRVEEEKKWGGLRKIKVCVEAVQFNMIMSHLANWFEDDSFFMRMMNATSTVGAVCVGAVGARHGVCLVFTVNTIAGEV